MQCGEGDGAPPRRRLTGRNGADTGDLKTNSVRSMQGADAARRDLVLDVPDLPRLAQVATGLANDLGLAHRAGLGARGSGPSDLRHLPHARI